MLSVVTAPSGTVVGDTDTQTLSAKTLTTPTIASFTNATHTHQDAAGGGTLIATSIFASGTVPTARLGSGTANSTTFLRGDQTWATPASGGSTTWLSAPELFSDATHGWKAQGAETFRTYPLDDASTKFVAGNCVVPATFTGISSIKLYYYGASVDGNNIVFRVQTGVIDKSSAGNTETADTTATLTTVAGTQTGIGILTAPADSYNALTIAAGNLLAFRFERVGADASDTYSSTIDVIGIEITWS